MSISDQRDPARFFAWDVDLKDSAASGRSGVTSDRKIAIGAVHGALERAEVGAYGKVRRVELSTTGEIAYLDLGIVGQAWRTESGVDWTE